MSALETRSDDAPTYEDDPNLTEATEALDELRSAVEAGRTEAAEQLRALEQRLDQIERRSQRPGAPRQSRGDDAGELERRAFANMLRHGAERLSADEQRALATSPDTAGGYLVPDQFVAEIVRSLTEFSPMRQVARVSTATSNPILLPKRVGQVAATWTAEGADSSATSPSYDQISIGIYEARCFVDVSNQLLEDSAFDLAAELGRDFGEEFARIEGKAFVSGTGSGQPEGFLTSEDFETDEVAGAAITADDLIDLYHAVPSTYASRGTWLMNRATMGAVRKLKDTGGSYIWQESLAAGNPPTILGRPVLEMPDLADVGAEAVPVAFGDWSAAFRIFDRVGLTILRDPYSVAAKSQVRFHARRRVGGALVNPEAVRGLAMPEA